MTFVPPSPALIYEITKHARRDDMAEFVSMRGRNVDLFDIAERTAADNYSTTTVVRLRKEPVMLIGVARNLTLPRLGQAWGLGTDKAWRVAGATASYVRAWIPGLREQGLSRVEVRVSSRNEGSLHWLLAAGAKYETGLDGWSNDGVLFHQLSWT